MALGTDGLAQAPGRWSKIAPMFGVLFVVFVAASVIVSGNAPASNASTASILHFYRTHKNQTAIAALLIPPQWSSVSSGSATCAPGSNAATLTRDGGSSPSPEACCSR